MVKRSRREAKSTLPLDLIEGLHDLENSYQKLLASFLEHGHLLEPCFVQFHPFQAPFEGTRKFSYSYSLIQQLYRDSVGLSTLLFNISNSKKKHASQAMKSMCEFISKKTSPLYVTFANFWEWKLQSLALWPHKVPQKFNTALDEFKASSILSVTQITGYSRVATNFPGVSQTSTENLLAPVSVLLQDNNDLLECFFTLPVIRAMLLDKFLYQLAQRMSTTPVMNVVIGARSIYSSVGKVLDKYESQREILKEMTTEYSPEMATKVG